MIIAQHCDKCNKVVTHRIIDSNKVECLICKRSINPTKVDYSENSKGREAIKITLLTD